MAASSRMSKWSRYCPCLRRMLSGRLAYYYEIDEPIGDFSLDSAIYGRPSDLGGSPIGIEPDSDLRSVTIGQCEEVIGFDAAAHKVAGDNCFGILSALQNRTVFGDKVGETAVKLVSDHVSFSELKGICQAVRANESIVSVEFGCNHLGDYGVTVVAECLYGLDRLEHFGFWGNSVTDEGAVAVGNLIKSLISLKSLNLSNNEITDDGLSSLSIPLSLCPSLRILDLSSNSISDHGAIEMVKTFRKQSKNKLETLILNNGTISNDGVASLSGWLTDPGCYLKCLDLSYNMIEDAGAEYLLEALPKSYSNSKGCRSRCRSIDMSGNLLSRMAIKRLLNISSLSKSRDAQNNFTISLEDMSSVKTRK